MFETISILIVAKVIRIAIGSEVVRIYLIDVNIYYMRRSGRFWNNLYPISARDSKNLKTAKTHSKKQHICGKTAKNTLITCLVLRICHM